jgi:molybdate transport repressor ModE-like protein
MKGSVRQHKPAVKPGFSLWISGRDPKEVFGRGKCQLLDAIEREGSLRAAALALGISYRKAWGDLRKVETALGVVFLERRRGGREGGETTLTESGRKWLHEYRRFYDEVERGVQQAFDAWEKRMAK